MRKLLLTMTVFASAAGLNTGSVALEQRTRFLTRRFGTRGWSVHLALVTAGWAGCLLSLRGLNEQVHWSLPDDVQPLGTPVVTSAVVLWLAAYRKLGATRTGNGNLFGHGSQRPVSGGVFRFRANPMYDSYVLALVGVALARRNAAYLLLAAEAAILCHGVEARVENRPLRPAVHETLGTP